MRASAEYYESKSVLVLTIDRVERDALDRIQKLYGQYALKSLPSPGNNILELLVTERFNRDPRVLLHEILQDDFVVENILAKEISPLTPPPWLKEEEGSN